jgi:uncharacterized protein
LTNDLLPPEQHAELAGALEDAGVSASAAEVHGIVSGVICAHGDATGQWQRLALGHDTAAPALVVLLGRLYRRTDVQLREGELDFELLLPGDDAGMPVRVEALADWCRGFLLGFNMVRGAAAALPDDATEVLEDFGHVAEAMPESGDDDEDTDRAFAELTEYVRVGAQLLYEEVFPADARSNLRAPENA